MACPATIGRADSDVDLDLEQSRPGDAPDRPASTLRTALPLLCSRCCTLACCWLLPYIVCDPPFVILYLCGCWVLLVWHWGEMAVLKLQPACWQTPQPFGSLLASAVKQAMASVVSCLCCVDCCMWQRLPPMMHAARYIRVANGEEDADKSSQAEDAPADAGRTRRCALVCRLFSVTLSLSLWSALYLLVLALRECECDGYQVVQEELDGIFLPPARFDAGWVLAKPDEAAPDNASTHAPRFPFGAVMATLPGQSQWGPRFNMYERIEELNIIRHGEKWKDLVRTVRSQLNQFSSDAFRWWLVNYFLYRRPDYHVRSAGIRNRTPDMHPPYFCFIEADIFIPDFGFLVETLNRVKPDIAHIQHMWGGYFFEPVNTGILCVSQNPCLWNRLLFKLNLWKNSRHWVRLLGGATSVDALLTNKHVFKWPLGLLFLFSRKRLLWDSYVVIES